MADTVQFYNPNDRVTGRDGGPYLDVEQAKKDEDIRAAKEDREPDYENLSANAGIPLQDARAQLFGVTVEGLPSMEGSPVANTIMANAHDDDTVPLKAWAEAEVPEVEEEVAEEEVGAPFDRSADQPNVGDDAVVTNSDAEPTTVPAETPVVADPQATDSEETYHPL